MLHIDITNIKHIYQEIEVSYKTIVDVRDKTISSYIKLRS